jgi:hypothetical protein
MSSRKKERQEMDELPIKPMDDKQLHFTMVRYCPFLFNEIKYIY